MRLKAAFGLQTVHFHGDVGNVEKTWRLNAYCVGAMIDVAQRIGDVSGWTVGHGNLRGAAVHDHSDWGASKGIPPATKNASQKSSAGDKKREVRGEGATYSKSNLQASLILTFSRG